MAEKLLEAIAKGSYKAVADPVKQTVKAAVDTNVMSTIYRTGIIGPLIRNAISEYKKGEPSSKIQTGVISDLSKNLNSLSVQLSSIADIMDDIRTLNSQQLKVDKDQFVRERKEIKKAEYKSLEDKIEAKKPGVSSLMEGAKQKFTDSVFGDLFGFVKDNPILSGLIVGTITIFSKELQEFFGGVFKGVEFDKKATEAANKLKETVGIGVGKIFDNLGVSINESLNSVLSSSVIGGLVGRLLGFRFKTGALAGAGVQIGSDIRGEDSSIGTSAVDAITGAIGGLLAFELGKYGLKKGGQAVLDKFRTPKVDGQIKPPVSSIPPTLDQQKQGMPYETMEEKRVRERKEVRASERGSIQKNVKRISRIAKKMGYKKFRSFMASRFGVFLGSLAGGPVGLIFGIIGAGYTMYQIGEVLDEIEQADTEGYDRGDEEMSSGIQRPELGTTLERRQQETDSSPTRPPLSTLNMDDYTRKVMAAESGGQNIKTPDGSAFGLYQITKGTFEGLQSKFKDLQKYTYKQFQQNTDVQKLFFDALTKDNAQQLERAGFVADEKNLYLAHRFGGPDAIRILRKSKEEGGLQTALKDILPNFAQIDQQNRDIDTSTTVAQAMFGAYGKMDKNIAESNPQLASAAMTPAVNPIENLSFIKELQTIVTELTGKSAPILINNPQNTSMSGSSRESNRAQPPTIYPYVQERDYLGKTLSMSSVIGA